MVKKGFRKIATSLFVCAAFVCAAQTNLEEIKENPDRAGGIYYAYPVTESLNTPAPEGYDAFYISHYARHGSRYLISDNDYRTVINLFEKADSANALTLLGKDVLKRLGKVWLEARGRGGELTPLGHRQHRSIARRMYKAFPGAFAGNPVLSARSTVVMRCAHSMNSFCEGLKEMDPSLQIPRESSQRNMYYLNYHSPQSNYFTRHRGPWYEENRKFEEAMTNPGRIVASLFSDDTFVLRNVNPHELMWGMYWVAVDMQNMECGETFTDIFTPEELFDLWRSFNYGFYVRNSNHPASCGMLLDNAKPLLRDILSCAEAVIQSHGTGGDFRFGHDGNLIPLAGLLHIENCYAACDDPYRLHEMYSDFKISPMAGNIQIVFFRNKDNDILVKFMLNEREVKIPLSTDCAPFYHWNDVKNYYTSILETPDYKG